MSLAASPPLLLTADEYFRRDDGAARSELVRGRIMAMSNPTPRHGYILVNIASLLKSFAAANRLGRVVAGDPAVITEREPDTVRGPDVAFYSFAKIPPGPMPGGRLDVTPELAIEIRSEHDRRRDILNKVSEYLRAGVTAVLTFDPERLVLEVHRDDETQTFRGDDRWALPDVLPGFSATVRELVE